MQDKKFKVAVIGCGAIAQFRHLPEYRLREDVEIIGVMDPLKDRARQVAAKFNVPEFFTDYHKLLALKPDLVSVCSPNAFHAEETIAALNAKAHVICEKPMALSAKEVKAMNSAARKNRRQLMIGHNQRLFPSHIKGREIYQSGMLGKCLSFRVTWAHGGPEGWSVDGLKCQFFKKRLAGFGSLADLGVHKTDLLRFLLNDEFVEVAAMCDTLSKPNCDVEDTAHVLLRTARGTLGHMFADWNFTPGSDNSTVLYCEKGQIRMEQDPNYPVVVEFYDGEKQFIKTKAVRTNAAGHQLSTGVIDAFVDAVKNGTKVPIPGEEGARSVAAIFAAIESSKTGRFVKVPKV